MDCNQRQKYFLKKTGKNSIKTEASPSAYILNRSAKL